MPDQQSDSPASSHRPRPRFASDRAIRRSIEDELGRGKFAARLADAIHRCDPREGLVVGLSGPWGCGKSSVKNMVLEGLQGLGANSPDVMEFNPWQITDQEQITLNFFRELLAKLNKDNRGHDPERSKQRAAALAKYGSLLSVTSTALKTAGVLLPILGLAGAAGEAASEALKKGAEATTAQAAAETESLSILKETLQELFAALERPLLIVIDDIDRLSAKEIPQVLQLVKSNADFPQIIYLLLYDKIIVENALNDVSNDRGKEFLEKIVQVSFDVPQISQTKIDQVLFAGLSEAIGATTIERRWSKERWTGFYAEHLQQYFRTLRAVRRFIASFSFQIDFMRHSEEEGPDVLEANPIDLVALECIRLFEPSSVYGRLTSLKGLLTRKRGNRVMPKDIDQKEIDRVIDNIVQEVPENRKDAVINLLKDLFPPVSEDYAGASAISSHADEWFINLRVCHEELFDRYFQLEIPEDEMSRADTESLIESLKDRENGTAELLALKERGLLITALDHLNRYAKTLTPEYVQSGILALCDVADDLPDQSRFWFLDDPETKAWRFCYWLLRQINNRRQRADIFEAIVQQSNVLRLPLKIVNLEQPSTAVGAGGYEHLFDENDLARLKQICAERVRQAAHDHPLAVSRRSDLFHWLWIWKDWGNDMDGVSKWIEKLIADPSGLLRFMSKSLSMRSSGTVIWWRLDLDQFEQFIPGEEVEGRLESVNMEHANESERLAVRCFKLAMQNRRDGIKPTRFSEDENEAETWEHYEQRLQQDSPS